MMFRKKEIPALVVTCAFAVFAIAAIPTHAIASSYYNSTDVSWCTDVFCDDFYNYGGVYGGNMYFDADDFGFQYGQPSTYSYPMYAYPEYLPEYVQAGYTYPTYNTYTYPLVYTYQAQQNRINTYVPYSYTPAQEYAMATRQFNNDFARSAAEWNDYANFYAKLPL